MSDRSARSLAILVIAVLTASIGAVAGCNKSTAPSPSQPPVAVATKPVANEVPPPAPPVTLDQAVVQPPVTASISDTASVAAVRAFNSRVRVSLTGVQKSASVRKLHYNETVLKETDLVKGLEAMLANAETARADIDAVIRTLEDLSFELRFAQSQLDGTSKLFYARAEATTDSSVRQINENTAQYFTALALDVPRRQKLVSAFLAEMQTLRTQIAEATRTLRDQTVASDISQKSLEPMKLSEKGKEYVHSVEEYLEKLNSFYDRFFDNAAYRDDVTVAKLPARK